MNATGYVRAMVLDRGFGFIRMSGPDERPPRDAFFHFRDLDASLVFDETLEERMLVFDIERTSKGIKARNIRPL